MGSEISQHCRRQIIFHKKLNMAGDKLIIDPSKRVKNACITNNASSQALMAKLSDQELGLENSLNLRNNASEESIGIHIKSNVKSPNFVSRSEWITLAILTFVNLINYMDRYTIAGVLTSVKETYQINNSEAGLLQTAFVASFMIFAPLFGYLGDRFNRNYVMIIGTTIISDLFVKDVRSKALAIFYFAIPVGSGLGYVVGQALSVAFGSWHYALRGTPILGAIAVLLLMFFLEEPKRGESEGHDQLKATSYKEDLKSLASNQSFIS